MPPVPAVGIGVGIPYIALTRGEVLEKKFELRYKGAPFHQFEIFPPVVTTV